MKPRRLSTQNLKLAPIGTKEFRNRRRYLITGSCHHLGRRTRRRRMRLRNTGRNPS